MRLIDALRNVDALQRQIPPRNWGGVEDEAHLCGCVRDCACTRGRSVKSRWLKAITDRKLPESLWLSELLADLERERDALDELPKAIFYAMYWLGLGWREVARSLGRSAKEFWRVHDDALHLIEAHLCDYFSDQRAAA